MELARHRVPQAEKPIAALYLMGTTACARFVGDNGRIALAVAVQTKWWNG